MYLRLFTCGCYKTTSSLVNEKRMGLPTYNNNEKELCCNWDLATIQVTAWHSTFCMHPAMTVGLFLVANSWILVICPETHNKHTRSVLESECEDGLLLPLVDRWQQHRPWANMCLFFASTLYRSVERMFRPLKYPLGTINYHFLVFSRQPWTILQYTILSIKSQQSTTWSKTLETRESNPNY